MTSTEHAEFHDPLVQPGVPELPDGFFDRLMFNLHPADAASPSVIVGYGIYPARDTADGFVLLTTGAEQRNLRFSTLLGATERDGAGPLRVRVVEPNAQWRLTLAPNEIGAEFDLTWRARTPAWWGTIEVGNSSAARTCFDHLFQSGRYAGTLTVDGETVPVDGWYGQRDRSRGLRTMSGGQGLHIWYQAQFPEFAIGFLLVETRTGERLLLEGAVMGEDGSLDPIIDVRHALEFTDGLDLIGGVVRVHTASGRSYRAHADAGAGGGYMAGAGYGGHHGVSHGAEHIESDRYPLDGSVSPRTLDSALTDRLCRFDLDGVAGSGIFEFALTRSSSYRYRPTLD
ncbi:DUF7064 domain-containing protein [Nocardia harenae]|uniref:DUF7064 domain-containing protein n=1 Tax=Nocardia harenae TaxID=358707 RepID=UPI00082CDBAA|nr:hypothetical protein [Nocardia harenae]